MIRASFPPFVCSADEHRPKEPESYKWLAREMGRLRADLARQNAIGEEMEQDIRHLRDEVEQLKTITGAAGQRGGSVNPRFHAPATDSTRALC
jgi:hypothetical protein